MLEDREVLCVILDELVLVEEDVGDPKLDGDDDDERIRIDCSERVIVESVPGGEAAAARVGGGIASGEPNAIGSG